MRLTPDYVSPVSAGLMTAGTRTRKAQQEMKMMGSASGTLIGLVISGDFQRRYNRPATLVPDTSQRAKLR